MNKDPITELLERGDELEAKATRGPLVAKKKVAGPYGAKAYFVQSKTDKEFLIDGMKESDTKNIVHACNTRRAHADIIRVLLDVMSRCNHYQNPNHAEWRVYAQDALDLAFTKARAIAEGVLK